MGKLILWLKGEGSSHSTLPSTPFEAVREPSPYVVVVPRLKPVSDPSLLLYAELAGWCNGGGE